jgi:RHS repeat-associated protein
MSLRFVRMALFALMSGSFLGVPAAFAAAEPIEYVWNWGFQTFDTYEKAVDALNAKGAGSVRVEQVGEEDISGDGRSIRYTFKVPDIQLVPSGLAEFYSGYGCSGKECASEGAAVAAHLALQDKLFARCNQSMTPIGGWEEASWSAIIGDPTNYFRYDRDYRYTYGVPNSAGVCNMKPPETWTLGRYVPMTSCPSGYETQIFAPKSLTGGRCVETRLGNAYVFAHAKPDCCAVKVGNPIAINTGAKLQSEPDYRSGTLSLTRHYSSLLQTAWNARLGPGWTHNYARHLVLVTDGNVGLVQRAGGERIPMVKAGATAWIAVGGRPLTARKITGGYTLSGTDGVVEHYDTQGRLLRAVDASGRIVETLAYDGNGRLITATDADGRSLQFAYGANDRLASVTDPAGGVYRYTYDSKGNLAGVANPAGETRTYHFENPALYHHLTGITDASGARVATFGYDAKGRAILTEQAGGAERHTVQYLTSGQVRVTGPTGAMMTYTFTGVRFANLLAAVSGDVGGGDGSHKAVSYNANGHMIQATDHRGTVTRWTRDSQGRETSRTEAVGTPEARTITTQWHATLNLPIKVTEPGRETEYAYSATGLLLSETVRDTATGEARTTTHTYTAEGRRETTDGPRTDVMDVTRWEYDAQGNVARAVNALGQATSYTYDAHGQPVTITDPNGTVTTLAYDAQQRLTSRTVAGAETRYAYDAAGLLIRTIAPDGSVLRTHYDPAHRPIAIEDGLGNRLEYTLDARGNRIEERTLDPAGTLTRKVQREYDSLNRLKALIATAGTTTYTYDAGGNRLTVQDPLNRTTASAYDPLNRLTQVTDAAGGVTRHAYDARGNLIEVIDPKGVTTRYGLDGFDQTLRVESPDAGTTTYTYDAAGNRVTQTDARGITASFEYDALNRLTAIRYPDSSLDITYVWDLGSNGVGRLASVQDGSGRTDYQYDARGNVIEARQTVNGIALVIGYAYDAADRIIEVRYPSGARATYARDAVGRIASVTVHRADGTTVPLATDIAYEPFGPLAGFVNGAGREHLRSYDLDGRLTAIDTLGVQGLAYGYDAAGNLTSLGDLLAPAKTQAFGYDALDRLTSAEGAYGSQAFTYDAVGNRQTENADGAITAYGYATDSHRLQSVGGRSYQYDAAGNTVSDGRFAYVYDARNRLGEVWSADGTARLARYAYNAQGQRALKVAGTPDDTDYLALALEAEARAAAHRASGDALDAEAEARITEADAKETEAATERDVQAAKLAEAQEHLADEQQVRSDAEAALSSANAAADVAHQAGVNAQAAAAQAEQASIAATAQAVALRAQASQATADAAALDAAADNLVAQAAAWRTEATAQEAYALDQRAVEAALLDEAARQYALEAQRRAEAAALLAEAEPELAKARTFRERIVDPPKNKQDETHNRNWIRQAEHFEAKVAHLTGPAYQKLAEADAARAAALQAEADAAAAAERSVQATLLAIALREQAAVADAQAAVNYAQADVLNAQAAQLSAQAGIQEQVALQQRQVQDASLAEAAQLFALEAEIRTNAAAAYAQASAAADAVHALALAADAAANEAEQRSIVATNAAIELRSQAAEATAQAAEQYILADAAQAEADHYRYLAENPPSTEETTLFAYDAQGHLIGEYDATGTLIREHVWLDDLPLATLTAEATYHIQADHLNTPVSMTDGAGTLVWQATREPFGETALDVSDVEQNLRFPGQYFDKETGLNQNWHRDYDPGIGRYGQVDPHGIADGPNVYAYAHANPVLKFDLRGEAVSTCCGMTSSLPLPNVMQGLECMSRCLETTILISSGWRNEEQNRAAGGVDRSQHLNGLAADVHLPPSMSKIRKAAKECGFFVLAKQYPNRVHVDLRDGRTPKTEPDSCLCQQIRGEP